MRRLAQAAQSLEGLPRRGRLMAYGRRELTIVYPYIIRYEIRGERVYIVRVRHGARAPDG